MSQELIARNEDLKRLKESGHSLRFQDGFLLIEDIPYLAPSGSLCTSALAMQLDLSGNQTVQPGDHVAYWTGEFPCTASGKKLEALGESAHGQCLGDGTNLRYMFSAKPEGGRYRDYEHKALTYIEIITREARKLDESATAQRWKVDQSADHDQLFAFLETASARQSTTDLAAKVKDECVAIVGLGGTGSYVLDFVAKTWVREIHLYDDDRFLQHNAFRSPGAVGIEELEGGRSKVNYLFETYSRMRNGIFAHDRRVDEESAEELKKYNTVFLCIDGDAIKATILAKCEQVGATCIDTGMGIYREGDKLGGIVRVTTSSPGHRDHIRRHNRIDMAGGEGGEYERNIQMAELNALNAALAVIKWKKLRGIYQDLAGEGDTGYVVDGNKIINRDFLA